MSGIGAIVCLLVGVLIMPWGRLPPGQERLTKAFAIASAVIVLALVAPHLLR